jgi:hypothetical protein
MNAFFRLICFYTQRILATNPIRFGHKQIREERSVFVVVCIFRMSNNDKWEAARMHIQAALHLRRGFVIPAAFVGVGLGDSGSAGVLAREFRGSVGGPTVGPPHIRFLF